MKNERQKLHTPKNHYVEGLFIQFMVRTTEIPLRKPHMSMALSCSTRFHFKAFF